MIRKTLSEFVRYIKHHKFIWYIKHHTTHQYHKLNLSQSDDRNDTIDHYKYGWIDADSKLRFAMFNILRNFVEKEIKFNYGFVGISKEVENEVKEIYDWWTIKRVRDVKRLAQLEHYCHTNEDFLELVNFTHEIEQDEENMMIRLIKIRSCLWT